MRKPSLFIFLLLLASQTALGFQSIVVLPFSNESDKQEIYWLGEGFAESLSEELLLKDVYVIERPQRKQAYEDLRLPYIGDLSRATMLKIGEKLAADYTIFGSYDLKDGNLNVQARVIRLSTLKLSDPIAATGPLDRLYEIQKQVCEDLIQYFVSEKFSPVEVALSEQSVPLHTYEAYIKGLLESTDAEKIKFFQRAIAGNPGYMQAIYRMGLTLSRLQRYKDSNECLKKGNFSEPLLSKVNFLMGLNSYYSQAYDEAYQKWLELSNTQPTAEVCNNIGVTLMQKEDFQNSGWYLSKAVEKEPLNPDYRFNVAASYIMRTYEKNAIQQYQELIKRRNNDYQAFYLMAKLLEKQATAEKSKDVASNKVMQFFKDTLPTDQKGKFPEMYTTVIQLLRTAPEFLFPEETQYQDTWRNKSLEDFASYVKTYQASAHKYLEDEEPVRAIIDIRKGIGLNPLDWYLHSLYGWALMQQKNGSGAEAELDFSLWCQDNLDSHLLLAELYRQDEKFADAKLQVQKSLALEPNNKKALELWNKIWDKN